MSLLETQRAFRSYLLDRPSDVMLDLPGDAAGGLAVYHNAYRRQLVAALKDSFERTWASLGDDAFEAAALSTHRSLPA